MTATGTSRLSSRYWFSSRSNMPALLYTSSAMVSGAGKSISGWKAVSQVNECKYCLSLRTLRLDRRAALLFFLMGWLCRLYRAVRHCYRYQANQLIGRLIRALAWFVRGVLSYPRGAFMRSAERGGQRNPTVHVTRRRGEASYRNYTWGRRDARHLPQPCLRYGGN